MVDIQKTQMVCFFVDVLCRFSATVLDPGMEFSRLPSGSAQSSVTKCVGFEKADC